MSDVSNDLTRVVEPEITRMKPLERLLSVFVSPVALMKNIKVYPAVLVPLLTVILISLAMLPFMTRYVEIQTRVLSNVSLERYGVDYFNLTPVDADETVTQTVSNVTQITSVVTALVTYPITAFFAALGLFIITKIARGKVKLGQYFSMYMHLFVITAIGGVLVYVLGVALDSTLDVTSLAAAFMPLGNITMPLYNVLSSVTLFNVWITVLSIIGIKIINDFSTVKAVVVGLIAFAFSIAITAISLSSTFLLIDFTNNLL